MFKVGDKVRFNKHKDYVLGRRFIENGIYVVKSITEDGFAGSRIHVIGNNIHCDKWHWDKCFTLVKKREKFHR